MQTAILPRLLQAPPPPASVADPVARETVLKPAHVASTAGFPPAEQFAAWQAQCGAAVQMEEPLGILGFRGRCTTWKLGPFAFLRASADGLRYRRDRAQVRRDALDHWIIHLSHRGQLELRTQDGLVLVRPGQPIILSLANSCEVVRSESEWISLVVPRDTFPTLAPIIDRQLYAPLGGSLGSLLTSYMRTLEVQLPETSESELPRLVEATRAMIAACIVPAHGQPEDPIPTLEHARLERVRLAIRQNLRSPTLTPRRLCRMVGMSRSQLYRLFEPLGGVARYIQSERLREAYRALANPDNLRGIYEVAQDLGFFDASAFSRTFRREFGCAPSEVRLAARSGDRAIALRRPVSAAACPTLTELLRSLQ